MIEAERTTYEVVVGVGGHRFWCSQHRTLDEATGHAELEAEAESAAVVGVYKVSMRGKQLTESELVGGYGGLDERPDLRGAMMRATRATARKRLEPMEYLDPQLEDVA